MEVRQNESFEGVASMLKEKQDNYAALKRVLEGAFDQASCGKGKERHAQNPEPFEKQQIVEIGKRLQGNPAAGPLFQAVKKVYESSVLPSDRAIQELYGAINYIAAAVLIFEGEASDVNA